jgi:hypothetical protein
MLSLDPDDAPCCARSLHHQLQATNNGPGVVHHHSHIFAEQGLTFGPVCDHRIHLRFRLDVCREPGAPGPYDTRIA